MRGQSLTERKNCSSDHEKLLKFAKSFSYLINKLEKIIGIQKHAGKVRKINSLVTVLCAYLKSIVQNV